MYIYITMKILFFNDNDSDHDYCQYINGYYHYCH